MGDKSKFDFNDLFGVDFAQQTTIPKKTTTKKNGKKKFDLNDLFGEEFEVNIADVEDQEYNHISQGEFLRISGLGFGLFEKGREEHMEERLYEIYNPNRK